MTKKTYQTPTMENVALRQQMPLLAGSLRSIESSGLGEESLYFDDKGGDLWTDAW